MEQTDRRHFIYNGELCRLRQWRCSDNKLQLSLTLTNYKQLLYSNHIREQDGAGDHAAFKAGALGISAIISAADEQLVLIRRAQTVGEAPGQLDVIGGHVEPGHEHNGVPDPFLAMVQEIAEETALKLADRTALLCIGLLETTTTSKPELVFHHKSHLESEQIIRAGNENDSPEVAEFVCVGDAPEAINRFLRLNAHNFSPSAHGCLVLYQQLMENIHAT